MSKFTGNIIRLPAVTPTQNSASGVYTLDDQFTAQSSGTWPIVRDQYFNYTTLLLTGAVQGTAYPNPVTQPYSFLSDASTNNFVVSPNGDVSARPFNPYLNNYSNYFDGTANGSLRADSTADTNLSGDFTIQAWVFPTASGQSSNSEIISRGAATTLNGWRLGLIASTTQPFFGINYASSGNTSTCTQSSTNIPFNQWTYVAVTRSGNTCRIYINGVLDTTNTGFTGTPTVSGTEYVYVGRGSYDTTNRQFTGYVTNASIIKGTALTTFSQTQPLATGTSGQALLTCTANRFIDTNTATTAKLLTVGSGASVSQNSPFVSYDTTNGSGYFDGTGDYLTAPSNIVDFAAGQAFTVECWVYVSSNTPSQAISANGANAFSLVISGGQVLYGKSGVIDLLVGTMAAANQWVHVAVGRNSSNTSRLWVNGTSVATSGSDTYSFNAATTYIGANSNPGAYLNGYMASLRVVKGTDVYGVTNTNITVPTAPLTPVSGTSLLTLQTRAPATNNGFIDSSPNNFVVTRNGNTTQGSFSPFSPTGWANYFGGSPTYLSGSGQLLGVGSNNFTVEAWVFIPTLSASSSNLILGTSTTSSSPTGIYFQVNSTGTISAAETWGINVWATTGLTFTAGTWNHVALCRSGSTARIFLNGVQASNTGTFSESYNSTSFVVGRTWTTDAANSSYMVGNISNLRVISGQALYSGNFNPPTAPFTATTVGSTGAGAATSITGTVTLLTCQDNRFKDNSPSNRTITVNGTPSVQAFSPFAPAQSYIPSQIGGSGYLDGTGDYLATASDAAFGFGTGDFTVEAWVYITGGSGERTLFCVDATNGANIGLSAGAGSNAIIIGRRGVDVNNTFGATPVSNAWAHVAIARSGTSITCWVNGAVSGTQSQSNSINYSSGPANIGAIATYAGTNFAGYIGSCRIVKGTAVYNPSAATITVPTAPLTPVTGTSLLLNFTNGGIVDATGKNIIETLGNATQSTAQSKWSNSGSFLNNGAAGSRFQVSSSSAPPLFNVGSGDYTVEFWVNTGTPASQQCILDFRNADVAGQGYALIFNTSRQIIMYYNVGNRITTSAISANVWTHVAVVRYNGVYTIYVDGSASGGTYNNSDAVAPPANRPLIGSVSDGSQVFNGNFSNFRISRIARYTSNFNTNLPSGPFPLG